MDMKHTPGPWAHTNDVSEEVFADIESVDGLLYIRAQWGAMRKLSKSEKQNLQDEMLANARLIAAAPDLLAALQLAVRQNSHDMLMTGEELRVCEAAIAKATRVAA